MFVIFSIFAGRQRYLSILMRFVFEMLGRAIIHECHLWDYTKNLDDHKHLGSYGSDSKIKIMRPSQKNDFGEYYRYYASTSFKEETILVKSDDDIVYIDVETIPAFLAFRAAHPHHLLCFPEIVNNGLCAHHMQHSRSYPGRRMLPSTKACPHAFELSEGGFESLVSDGEKGAWLHGWFLDALEGDAGDPHMMLPAKQRVSINMFAMLAKDLHLLAHPDVTTDDETTLTQLLPTIVGRRNSMFLGTTVSHFGFGPQRTTGLDGEVEESLLKRYDNLSKRCVCV